MMEFISSGNALIVKIKGDIDAESVKRFRNRIDVEYDCASAKDIIFDMTNVNFMDSTGIGMIIGRYKKAALLNGSVKIVGASERMKRIITLSGLGKIVKIYESCDAATRKERAR